MEKLNKEIIISEIKKREKEIKKKFHIKHLFLFGSYARDEQKETSDIDILVEFQIKYKNDIGLCEKERIVEEYRKYIINEDLIGVC